MFQLTSFIDDSFEYNGKIYHIDMAFDNILLLFEMFDDIELYEHEKVFIALQMLIREYDNLQLNSYEETYELFKYILNEFIDIDLENKDSEKSKDYSGEEDQEDVKMYDFKKDAELIFASFFAIYKIDLFELQGKLHWKKFKALLTYLDDNSPFKQVIGYRMMKIPSEKEASKEYRQHIMNMKRIHSLEDKNRDVTKVFDSVASMLKSKGVKKHG